MVAAAHVSGSHLHRLVAVGGEVLGLEANQQAAPQAGGDCHKQVPVDAVKGSQDIHEIKITPYCNQPYVCAAREL